MEEFIDTIKEIHRNGDALQMIEYLNSAYTAHDGYSDVTEDHPDRAKECSLVHTDPATNCPHKWDSHILWVCPTLHLLQNIAHQVKSLSLTGVTSVGCGTGLLEWLIEKVTELPVRGVETNVEWWKSRYAPPQFIPVAYVDESSPGAANNESLPTPPTTALLFCYFNNHTVFRKYLAQYQGPLLLLIGSCMGDTLTSPGPLDLREDPHWVLRETVPVREGDRGNLMGVYWRREG